MTAMKRAIAYILAAVIALALVMFLGDLAWLEVRTGRHQNVYDTVTVEVVDQIPQKGNKAEYVPEPPQPQTCVRSLFPHSGNEPCWYLRRHTQQQVNF